MSEPKSANPDPSMDDILASIRKIISADEARAQVSGGPPPRPAAPALHAVATPSPAVRVVEADAPQPDFAPQPDLGALSGAAAATGRDDVLLLTDLIEEPRGDNAPAPLPLPRIDPVRAGEMPQPALAAEPPPASGPALVEQAAAGTAAQAFARLSQAVQESVLPAAHGEAPTSAPAGGRTVEELAADLLRPMLKDWLDRNLPALVERLVEREIARLTRR